ADLVARAVDLAAPTLLSHNTDVRMADDLESIVINVDAKLLGQVLLNLLLNAAEAIGERAANTAPKAGVAAASGLISISAQRHGNKTCITIDDNGPGIPPSAIENIFNPFFTTKHTGTGLGLAIVHRIIEAHGGRIAAENRPGGGARFVITL